MVQRQIVVRRPQRLPIPTQQLALLILLPPALIAGICLYLGVSLIPAFTALGISVLALALAAGLAGKRMPTAPAAVLRGRRPAAHPKD